LITLKSSFSKTSSQGRFNSRLYTHRADNSYRLVVGI
jgi:hypothetical protein